MNFNSKIYIAGHRGMVGSAIVRRLKKSGFDNLLYKTSEELDLRVQVDVASFFKKEKPEYVFMAAAKVGGILANRDQKADFIYENLSIQNNIIHHAHVNNVVKLLFLGSSCIYPKLCDQPIKEEYILTGRLEETNDAYAVAKIAGIKMCDAYREQYGNNFISAMPTNLYGENDNYHPQKSHVIPALIQKFVLAKRNNVPQVVIWGSGTPKREFLYVDDLADASLFLMKNFNEPGPINVGSGIEISIKNLAIMIKRIVDYPGELILDTTKPDGTPRKLLDTTKLSSLGWKYQVELEEGLKVAIDKYIKKYLS